MIRINLIRGKRKKRREFNVGFAFLLVPLIVLAGTLYFHTTVTGKIKTLQQDIQKANADIARLKKEIGEVEKFKARKAELQKKVDIISSLQSNRSAPVKLFEALSAAIPEKCWIDKLDIQGNRISLSGMALNNNTVANFMTALGQTGRFRDVTLGSADQSPVGSVKLVRFNLTFLAAD
jgi:type IV pilus assembly protein PilN